MEPSKPVDPACPEPAPAPVARAVSRYCIALISAWTAFIVCLTCATIYYHHLDTLKEAENEARNYIELNRYYRSWAAELGGIYAPPDKVAPNPYLTTSRRDITSSDGRNLTLVNPAYMSRMVFENIRKSSPNPVISKLTSLKPLNPGNSADPWESAALSEFARGGSSERSQLTSIDGKPYLRLISRFTTEPPCLSCHAAQGYRVGDVRGGITISIPMAGYYASEAKTRNRLMGGYLVLWCAGCLGIAGTSRWRLRYEDELRVSEEKFRTICDWTKDWEYWADPCGTLKYVSPSCREVTGYRPEDFLQDPDLLLRIVHPEDRELFASHREVFLPEHTTQTSESLEFRIVARDGTVRWIHHGCRPVYSGASYRGRRVSNRDVTERKLYELELAIRAQLLNSVSDSVLVTDRAGKILDANEIAWRSRGYTLEELLSLNISDLSTSPPALVWERIEQVFTQGSANFESCHRLKDGGEMHVEVNAKVIDYRGKTACLNSVRDISKRKQAEESLRLSQFEQQQVAAALQESERTLRVLFDVIQSGIVQVDGAGTVTFANQRMAEMFGTTLPELIGSSYLSFICPDQDEEAGRKMRSLMRGETDCIYSERHYRRADGSQFWGYLTGRRLLNAEGGLIGLVGTITDLTELRTAEEKRLKVEQQMLHVQKLESLGVLAGGIAHDFNNILLAIMGNASLALHRLPPESAAGHHLHQIEIASGKAADLARQMLAYSGKGHFVLQPVDLNQLILEMTTMLKVSISKKAELRLDLAGQVPSIVADPTQVRQVVMNLAINASEAIGEKSGVIGIATGYRVCERGFLADTWLNDDLPAGPYVFLEVTDTGCGMDRETMGRIFEPFFSTKFTGRGLGMAAILGIVRGHKGAISVYSEPGEGTTFKIYLPASERRAEVGPDETVGGAWRGRGTVLLVDDEETVRAVGAEMLKALGLEVICASDGREAIELYRERGRETALVLMDLTMPTLNGEEAFHELCRIDPAVRVVLSSGFSEQEVARKFEDQGLAGFIQKPYTLATLRKLMSTLLPAAQG